MTRTPISPVPVRPATIRRLLASPAAPLRPAAEVKAMLREMAFVFQLTERVKESILRDNEQCLPQTQA